MAKSDGSAGRRRRAPVTNQWEAMFSSVTRPILPHRPLARGQARASPDDYDDIESSSPPTPTATASGGYTITIQHTMNCKSLRRHALSSSYGRVGPVGGDDGSNNTAPPPSSSSSSSSRGGTMAGATTGYGISGPFLVNRAFEELCRLCDGALVYVSSVDDFTLDINVDANTAYRVEGGERGLGDDDGGTTRWDATIRGFRRNGACVDLSSDPCGWEGEYRQDDDDSSSSFVRTCAMDKLRPIAMAIRRAAADVESRRSSSSSSDENRHGNDGTDMHRGRRPVPIVFDTLTPLLHIHGVERVIRMLKSLRAVNPSSSAVLSPIIVPVLHESLRPSEQRSIEDASDALVSIKLLDAPTSNGGVIGYGSTFVNANNDDANDSNTGTVVASGMMDLVRRGGEGGGIRGGKLVRHCVPFRLVRSSLGMTTSRGGGDRMMDERCRYGWIFDTDTDRDDVAEDTGVHARARRASTDQSTGRFVRTTNDIEASVQEKRDGPRIYYQDNDPEFDDLDEEDGLDDDLDL